MATNSIKEQEIAGAIGRYSTVELDLSSQNRESKVRKPGNAENGLDA